MCENANLITTLNAQFEQYQGMTEALPNTTGVDDRRRDRSRATKPASVTSIFDRRKGAKSDTDTNIYMRKSMVVLACPARARDMAGALSMKRYSSSTAGTYENLKADCPKLDVVVMELVFADIDGIEIIRFLGNQLAQPELIFVSDLDPRIVSAAKRLAESKGLRVRAVLPLKASVDEVGEAISRGAPAQPAVNVSPMIISDTSHLRRGMANDEFVVHYQPKIDVDTLELVSLEALVRWRHPDYGLLGPYSFIPLAEQTGLISPLTEIIVDKAFSHACAWRESGIPHNVAINISGASLADLSLPDQLAATANKYELSPDGIVIEITESWVVKNPIDALDILTRLRMKGFNLSIDDFGTGYSSMLKLKQIPFSELKLDQSIIRGAATDKESRVIVETSIELGHRLGLHLVAEGVERQDDWDLISDLGCNEGQGFFIARPMSANDLPDWHDRWKLSLGI